MDFIAQSNFGLNLQDLVFANGLFVALARNTSVDCIMTSSDGIAWTQQTTPNPGATVDWRSLVYNPDIEEFLVYGDAFTSVLYSPDGVAWSLRALDTNRGSYDLAYGSGLYVNASGTLWRSSNTINWTLAQSGWSRETVDFVNNTFISTGGTGGGLASTYIGVSANGISWTTKTIPLSSFGHCAYGNGTYVLPRGRLPGGADVMTSPDLTAWTIRPTGLGNSLWDNITFNSGFFVMTCSNTSGNKVASSPDGINWTAGTITGATPFDVWKGVAFGNSTFVMVSSSGYSAYSVVEPELSQVILRRRKYKASSGL